MKKEVNKIVLVSGFLVAVVGLWITAIASSIQYIFNGFSVHMLVSVLALAFVLASNQTLKIIGYSFNALLGAHGMRTIVLMDEYIRIGELVTSIGFIIMAVASLIYLVVYLLGFFGFVKKERIGADCLCKELAGYKELLADGILSEEEFAALKQRSIGFVDAKKGSTMEDLKKWKKLLDQQIISEEEFADVKKSILAK